MKFILKQNKKYLIGLLVSIFYIEALNEKIIMQISLFEFSECHENLNW